MSNTATAELEQAVAAVVEAFNCGHLDGLVGANRELVERLAYAEAAYINAHIEAELKAEEAGAAP